MRTLVIKKMIGLLILLILAGCSGNPPDAYMPPGNYIQLSPNLSGKMQSFQMKDLCIELSSYFDKDRDIIEAKGRIKLNHDKIPVSAQIYNFSMKVYLLDKNYRILEKMNIWDTRIKSAKYGIPLELTFDSKSEYAFITFDYNFDYSYSFT